MLSIIVDLSEVERELDKLSGRQIENALGRGTLAGAFIVERAAKRIVPVDTGTLRASIRSEPVGRTAAKVFTNVEYAGFVEYGTSRMAAQPYMRPALDNNRRQIAEAVLAEVRKALS